MVTVGNFWGHVVPSAHCMDVHHHLIWLSSASMQPWPVSTPIMLEFTLVICVGVNPHLSIVTYMVRSILHRPGFGTEGVRMDAMDRCLGASSILKAVFVNMILVTA